MIQDYINIVTNPREGFTAIAKRKYALMDSAMVLVAGAFVATIVQQLINTFSPTMIQPAPIAGFGLAVVIGTIVLFFQTGFSTAIIRLLASWMKGKGTYEQNMALESRLVPLSAMIGAILTAVPVIGIFLLIIWMIYSFYLSIHAVSIANSISMRDAAIVLLIPLLIVVGLIVIIAGPVILLAAIGLASQGAAPSIS